MERRLNFGLGANVYRNLTRPSAIQFLQQQPAPALGPRPQVSQGLLPLRRAVLEQQMRPRMTPAQQFTALTPPMAPPSRPDRPKRSLLDGILPGAGTPEAAGLGAAGQRMLELSGYTRVPRTMGEILGEAAKAYTTTRSEAAATQAAAERQRQQDAIAARREEIELANIQSQIRQREKPPAAPVSGLPQVGATRDKPLPGGMIQRQEWDGEKYVNLGQPFASGKGSPKVPETGKTRDVPLPNGMVQRQEWDGSKYVNLGEPFSKDAPKVPVLGSTRDIPLDNGMIQRQEFNGEKYVPVGKPFSKDQPKVPTMGAMRQVRKEGDLIQDEQWDGEKYVSIGVPYKSDKPSTSVKQVYTSDGDFVGSFSADDPALERYMGTPNHQIITKTLTGGAKDIGLTKPTKNKLQDKVISAKGTIAGLESTMQAYDPDLLTAQGALYGTVGRIKDRFDQATPEEKDFIKRQSRLARRAFESLNQYIKDITGAQMSAAEYDRLALAFPVAPQGLFSTLVGKGDSPTVFAEKLGDVYMSTKMALARYNYAMKNGLDIQVDEDDNVTGFLDPEGVPISIFSEDANSMQSIIERRAVALETELSQQGLTGEDLEFALEEAVKQEFGI